MVTQSDINASSRKIIVATAAEWRASGVSPARLRSLARGGELTRIWHGVYANRPAIEFGRSSPARGHALRVAAVRAATGRDAVASHHSAALLHGLDLYPAAPDLVTLTRPPQRRSSRLKPEGITFHTAELPADHVTRLHGVAVTTVARTVVDLARMSSFMSGVVTADSALHADVTTREALAAVCATCKGWPGIRKARRVADFSDGRAESVLESCARVIFAEYGIEPPELQVSITGDDFRFSVDFYWPRHRVIAEADGALKYSDAKQAMKQLGRDQKLRDAGYVVVHFTWRELFENPEVVVARIRRALAAAIAA